MTKDMKTSEMIDWLSVKTFWNVVLMLFLFKTDIDISLIL